MPFNRNGNPYMQIIPTTELQTDFYKAEARVKEVKDTSRWIQVDVLDDEFAPGKTFQLELLSKIDFNTDKLLWDIHLMVKEPDNWLEKCIFVGANRITGQVEMMKNREEFVNLVKTEGLEVGLAFDIETEVDNIPEETDLVLIMGRKAGYDELPLEEKIYEKIEKAKEIREKRNKKFLIAVDGGVNENNIEKLKEAGVDVVYSGNNYFGLINGN